MAIYQRSNLAFATSLFTLGTLDLSTLLSANADRVFAAIQGGSATSLTFDLGDGSTVTLTGSFSSNVASTNPRSATVTGTVNAISRNTAGGNIETLAFFSVPFDASVNVIGCPCSVTPA